MARRAQIIFRESMRVMLLHPTHFHSISIFLFSPLPLSLFLSHFLALRFPQIPSLPAFTFADNLLGFPPRKLLSKTILHIIICLPCSLTFSLLGRAATVQAVSDTYRGVNLDGKRLLIKSGLAWIKLLHTSFCEFLVVLALLAVFVINLAVVPKVLHDVIGICSEPVAFWVAFGVLGGPFCVVFAHVTVVGNLARVASVSGGECCGFEALLKAKSLVEGRRETALVVALSGSAGLRLVEGLFELRMGEGMNMWEVPVLVSMYSLVLVVDTVMNAVFYFACKSLDD